MARTLSINEYDFNLAYKDATNVQDICNALGVSTVTVYKYLERYKLPAPSEAKTRMCRKVFEAYRGRKTMQDVATELRLTVGSVRHYLSRAINLHWAEEGRKLPMPTSLRLIKVAHEVELLPSIAKFPARIARATGIKESMVAEYLKRRKNK